MRRALIAVGRIPSILYQKAKGIDHRRIVPALVEAFGSAAAASLYCATSYTGPEELAAMDSDKTEKGLECGACAEDLSLTEEVLQSTQKRKNE
ncbi:hypothetical protein J2858_004510 [Neorhizobium galegae]|uniref:hypothetical protein n=1 Tax=Neorhizobium galegae TaxID=399 RepID=UPI001AE82F4A|nr:hypothetical protein [Neorhizobium galegae]MBP2551568.1 hypothetical protein [Neorhizobium galegae]